METRPTTDTDLAIALSRATSDAVERTHDAIVVGAGASGGLAAQLLCEAGLNVLVLDAGWRLPFWRAPLRRSISAGLKAIADPRLVRLLHGGLLWRSERALRLLGQFRQPVQSRCYAWPTAPELFIDDRENPYETAPEQPFTWIRARGLGGRMAVPAHGRQYLRHSRRDFEPVDGLSPAWPFAPQDLDPWYEMVEAMLGLSGRREGSAWVPDSRIADEREPTRAEIRLMEMVRARFLGARPVLGRYAPPMPSMSRAAKTGRMICRQGAVVRHVELEPNGRASGVVFYDQREGTLRLAKAPMIFLGASTLESTRILLASRNERMPGGIGARSGALGRFLMDHVSIKVQGVSPSLGLEAKPLDVGQCLYLPRFDARETGDPGDRRGFGVRVYYTPAPGRAAHCTLVADAEMLPDPSNCVTLSGRSDAWGLPTLRIAVRHGPRELKIASDQAAALNELVELIGLRPNAAVGGPGVPGSAIHECGAARMGADPSNSVLDPFNQAWEAPGLYVIDGAAFPSEGLVNPTLTILALTARACDQATRSL